MNKAYKWILSAFLVPVFTAGVNAVCLSAPAGIPIITAGCTTNALNFEAITGVAGNDLLLEGISVTGMGATAALPVSLIIYYQKADNSGLQQWVNIPNFINVPAGVITPITPMQLNFNPPLHYPIVMNAGFAPIWEILVGAFGAGNPTNGECAALWGFQ